MHEQNNTVYVFANVNVYMYVFTKPQSIYAMYTLYRNKSIEDIIIILKLSLYTLNRMFRKSIKFGTL